MNSVSYTLLRSLVLGYSLILIGGILGVSAELANFAGVSVSSAGTVFYFSSVYFGVVITIYSSVRCLYRHDSIKKLLTLKNSSSNRLKYIFILFFSLPYLTMIFDEFYNNTVPGFVSALLTIFGLIFVAIYVPGILYILIGPIYIILFYYFVIRNIEEDN